MKLKLLIDSGAFWRRLKEEILQAKDSVYIQTLSFEGDSTGLQLAEAMDKSKASDKRIIVDSYTKYIINDKLLLSPKHLADAKLRNEKKETFRMIDRLRQNGTKVRFVNPFGFMFIHLPARNHKKIILVDNKIAYIGGINFSDHNFAWHDLMLRIEDGDAADFLKTDFYTSWKGNHFGGRKRFGEIEIHSLDGKNNISAFEPIIRLIDNARKSIYVQSPYLCFPFSDKLREASKKGVKIQIVSPQNNNKKTLRKFIEWESNRSGFDLRMYQDGMTHVKAMLIDESNLILGSCNFDCFSYYYEQETFAVVSDKNIIADFKENVIEKDNASSIPFDGRSCNLIGQLRSMEMRAANRIFGLFN